MDAPSTETIKKQFDSLNGIVEWAVEIWYSRNWVKRLILLDVILFLAFNPYFKTVLRFLPATWIPKYYDLYFWLMLVGVFVAALVTGIRARAEKKETRPLGERRAIKGLLAFGMGDAEVFARLQRETELKECYEAITAREFRFGILSGESGTGKSSFLQADLCPAIKKERECVYVKFTDYDPLLTMRQAILEQVAIPEDKRGETSLVELLKVASAQAKIEANWKVAENEIKQLQEKLKLNNLWLIYPEMFDSPTFFFFTDKQVEENSKSEMTSFLTSEYFNLLKTFDEFNYIKRDEFVIKFDSKENFEKSYSSSWYYYDRR